MPIWITALGVSCIGSVCGYVLFYSFKRHNPPMSAKALPISEVLTMLAAVGAGGIIGGAFLALEKVNYIGPYGIGLLVGTGINVLLTLIYEDPFGRK